MGVTQYLICPLKQNGEVSSPWLIPASFGSCRMGLLGVGFGFLGCSKAHTTRTLFSSLQGLGFQHCTASRHCAQLVLLFINTKLLEQGAFGTSGSQDPRKVLFPLVQHSAGQAAHPELAGLSVMGHTPRQGEKTPSRAVLGFQHSCVKFPTPGRTTM